MRAFTQGQCLSRVRLKCRNTSRRHCTGGWSAVLGLQSQSYTVSAEWARRGSTAPQEGQAATGRALPQGGHCHRRGTATVRALSHGRALPHSGHCHRRGTGSSGPCSLCSEPSVAVQAPSSSAQLEQMKAPHPCAHGSQVTALGRTKPAQEMPEQD